MGDQRLRDPHRLGRPRLPGRGDRRCGRRGRPQPGLSLPLPGRLHQHQRIRRDARQLRALYLPGARCCARIPGRALQHPRRGPVLHRGAGRRLRRLLDPRPPGFCRGAARPPGGDGGGLPLRRDRRLPEGADGGARGDHHDHAQLHRVPDRQLPGHHARPDARPPHPDAADALHRHQLDPSHHPSGQPPPPRLAARPGRGAAGLVPDRADDPRLPAPGGRLQRRRGAGGGHLGRPHNGAGDGHLGRAGSHRRDRPDTRDPARHVARGRLRLRV